MEYKLTNNVLTIIINTLSLGVHVCTIIRTKTPVCNILLQRKCFSIPEQTTLEVHILRYCIKRFYNLLGAFCIYLVLTEILKRMKSAKK